MFCCGRGFGNLYLNRGLKWGCHVACVAWRFCRKHEWAAKRARTSGEAARKVAPAPVSSRFLCPRPPLLFSALNQNRHATQATIPDKTTWESFPHHVHFPMATKLFPERRIADRKPLPPIQCCFLQTPRDQAFFWIRNNIAFRGRGRGKNRYSYDV